MYSAAMHSHFQYSLSFNWVSNTEGLFFITEKLSTYHQVKMQPPRAFMRMNIHTKIMFALH